MRVVCICCACDSHPRVIRASMCTCVVRALATASWRARVSHDLCLAAAPATRLCSPHVCAALRFGVSGRSRGSHALCSGVCCSPLLSVAMCRSTACPAVRTGRARRWRRSRWCARADQRIAGSARSAERQVYPDAPWFTFNCHINERCVCVCWRRSDPPWGGAGQGSADHDAGERSAAVALEHASCARMSPAE